jgi:hypothetical protein
MKVAVIHPQGMKTNRTSCIKRTDKTIMQDVNIIHIKTIGLSSKYDSKDSAQKNNDPSGDFG